MTLSSLGPRSVALRVRLWWNAPHGHHRERLIGPSDWELAGESSDSQVDRISETFPASKSLEWVQAAVFAGYRDDEAFRIDAEDDTARSFLDAELLRRRRDEPVPLRQTLSWLARYALLRREGFAQIQFEDREGMVGLDTVRIRSPRGVRRRSGAYLLDPSAETGYPLPEHPPYVVPASEMIDVAKELPTSDDATVRQVIDDFWRERLLDHATIAGMQAAAQPERTGLRWDAARMRRVSVDEKYLLHARTSFNLSESLIHRAIWFSQPAFTKEFLLWQHHRCMIRALELREALVETVNAKVISPLMRRNGFAGTAALASIGVRSRAELDELYQRARDSAQTPTEFYRATTS